jgi:hypothetical protein
MMKGFGSIAKKAQKANGKVRKTSGH